MLFRSSFTAANVSKTFKRVNPRKAAGTDVIPSRILRACADQLAGVFTDIFNQSLSQSAVPTCFKRVTIVPVPKKANLRRLKKLFLSPKALFYRCTIESILSGCITAWYGNCSAHNHKAPQRVLRSAQRITGGKLPVLQDTYTT